MPIYALKTTAKQEQTVVEMIANRDVEEIHSALAPEDTVSYVFIEADDEAPIERLMEDIPHARSMLDGEMDITEVEHFLEPSSDVEGIAEGDVVEVTDGPFQGDKAQVQRIDEGNNQVTVELYEATVPIPVTVRGDQIRVLDSEER